MFKYSEFCLYIAPKLSATNPSEFEDFFFENTEKVTGNAEVL